MENDVINRGESCNKNLEQLIASFRWRSKMKCLNWRFGRKFMHLLMVCRMGVLWITFSFWLRIQTIQLFVSLVHLFSFLSWHLYISRLQKKNTEKKSNWIPRFVFVFFFLLTSLIEAMTSDNCYKYNYCKYIEYPIAAFFRVRNWISIASICTPRTISC